MKPFDNEQKAVLRECFDVVFKEMDRQNLVLGTLISWLSRELGVANAQKLLDQLNELEERDLPITSRASNTVSGPME